MGDQREQANEEVSPLLGKAISGASLAILVVALRIGLANLSPISDCDEVYNYWEPVHFLRFGTGMQTWEYAPQYALRTYAYLAPMALISKVYELILSILPSSLLGLLGRSLSLASTGSASAIASVGIKPLQFNMLRSTLAAMTALSELNLHHAISKTISPSIADWTLIASVSSAGMFHASVAYLPSAQVMSCWMCSSAAQLRGNDSGAIILGLIAVLAFGWPFSAVLFVTTGLWAVYKAAFGEKQKSSPDISAVVKLLLRTIMHACIIQSVVMAIDYVHYGKLVSPTLNIFIYNTKGQGDELYGIEPLSYYIKNLFLNLNFVSIFGFVALPVVALVALMDRRQNENNNYASIFTNKMLLLLPMYIWLAVVAPRPHKEERFLFPIYPMLCVGAGLVVDEIATFTSQLIQRFAPSTPWTAKMKQGIVIAALLPIVLLSVSRSAALVAHYSSPLKAYAHLHQHITSTKQDGPVAVCVGGEWYRYPSSFYLPPNADLGFLKSSFGGQLPQPFTEYGSKEKSIAVQSGHFNDLNQEETDRYVDFQSCSYVVELVDEDTEPSSPGAHLPEGLEYMKKDGTKKWREIFRYPYLDVERTSSLHRILYLPFLRKDRVVYKGYAIYERVR